MVKSLTVTIVVSGTTPPPPTPASISIAADDTTPTVGQTVTISGVYLDTNGNGIVGATLYLFVGGTQRASTVTTAGGAYSYSFVTTAAGSFLVDVADNTGNT